MARKVPAPGSPSCAVVRDTHGIKKWPVRSYLATIALFACFPHQPFGTFMRARQVVIREPFQVEVREVELPPPKENQILVAAEVSAVSPGTELAVYTGTHQWLK